MSFFIDKDVVISLIGLICQIENISNFSIHFEKLSSLLSKYQEQPSLLNSSMTKLMEPLSDKLIDISTAVYSKSHSLNQIDHLHGICQTIQLLCRIRGFKSIQKYFTHEVFHLEICLHMLRLQVITY